MSKVIEKTIDGFKDKVNDLLKASGKKPLTLADANKAGKSLKQLEHERYVPLDKRIQNTQLQIRFGNEMLTGLKSQLSSMMLEKLTPLAKKWEGKCFRKFTKKTSGQFSRRYYKWIHIIEVTHEGINANIIIDADKINDIKFCVNVNLNWSQFKAIELNSRNLISRQLFNNFVKDVGDRLDRNFWIN